MEKISQVIKNVVQELFNVDLEIHVSRPDSQFGDFATNVAMQLTKNVGQNPREIAQKIVDRLSEEEIFSEVTIAGPGFINVKMTDKYLSAELEQIIVDPKNYGKSDSYNGKIVITEYSDPNPFKVLHVGHLYTSIIGDAVSNLIESAGGTVHRVNFGGDVGLHVGKTMWAIVKNFGGEYPEKLSEIDENNRSQWMASCYVEGTRAYEDDEQAKSEITAMNKKVYQIHTNNDHDSNLAKIYWVCRTWSYDYFNAFYNRIGTKFEKYYPESEVAPLGLRTVIEQKNNGIYKDSDGAVIFEGEPYDLHTRVFVNKEGLPTYEAKDVGLSIRKWDDYHFDESVIITGNDIIEYMKVVLKSIEQFRPDLSSKTRHFTHGNVKLAGGVKMSSRMGNFLRAVDVLDMTADANEKSQGNRDEAPVLGAIKYAFLKNRIGADTIFEPEESVSLQGNSGPYLQYALARANSIFNKRSFDGLINDLSSQEYTIYERNLLIKVTEFSEVLQTAVSELMPHHLCTFLYELAQEFNRFYENSRIIDDEREQIRLGLVFAYASVLKNGLTILGIPTPEKM